MVGLPCLVSQCAKLHASGWKCAVFTRIYLESCTWPVAIFTMDQRKEQRVCIMFCANLGKSATEIFKMIQQAFGDQSLSRARVFQWHVRFKTGRTSVDNDKHRGRPTKLNNSWNSCTNSTAHPSGSTSDHLWHCWGGGNWLWDMPTGSDGRIEHAACQSQILCPGSWELTRSSSASTSALNFVSSPPTMKPSCPRSSLVMRARLRLRPWDNATILPMEKPHVTKAKKDQTDESNLKSMIITFFEVKRIVHKEFVPTGQTVNSRFYCEVLRRLRENVRRRRPKLWGEQTWLLHHDNAPSQSSVLTQQFLERNKIAVIPHSPYFPDLAPCYFFLFPKMKLKLKGSRFDNIEEIKAELQRVLDTLKEKDFQEAFKKWMRRWDRCLHAGGNYFRVIVTDRSYDEFYDFYSVNLENFGYRICKLFL